MPLFFFLQVTLFLFVFCFYLFFGCVGSSLLAARGLSLVASSRGFSLLAVCGLLIAVASLVAEQGSRRTDFSSCGTRAQ